MPVADRQDQRVLDWIGGIPDRWEVHSLGSQLAANKSSNKGLIESRVLSLSYGRVIVKPLDKLRGLVPESFETYQIVEPGDIVIRPTDLQNDHTSLRVGQSMHRGIITSAYICLRPTNSLNHRYASYLLAAYDFMKVFYGFGSGLRQNLDVKHIKHIPVPVPELDEQGLIVRYLDQAELRIAKAIATKQRMIALLDEREELALLQAITESDRPKTADSRLDWLGDFPAHWDVKRLGSLLEERNEMNADRSVQQVLSLVRKRGVMRYEDKGRIGNKRSDDVARYKVVREGDIVLNSMNVIIGSVGQSAYTGCLSPVYYVLKPRSNELHNSYFNALFQVERFHSSLVRFGKGILAHRLRIPMIDLKTVMLPVPPPDEQLAIADRVVKATAELKAAKAGIEAEISLLKEYRTRLISDVVTGKLDVRKEAAKLPVIDPIDLMNAAVGENGDNEEASDDD